MKKARIGLALLTAIAFASPAWAGHKRPTYRNWTTTQHVKASGVVPESAASMDAITGSNPDAVTTDLCNGSALPLNTETALLALSTPDGDTGDTQNWIQIATGSLFLQSANPNGNAGCPSVTIKAYIGRNCASFSTCGTALVLFTGSVCTSVQQPVPFVLPNVSIPPSATSTIFITATIGDDGLGAGDTERCSQSSYLTIEHNGLGTTAQ